MSFKNLCTVFFKQGLFNYKIKVFLIPVKYTKTSPYIKLTNCQINNNKNVSML